MDSNQQSSNNGNPDKRLLVVFAHPDDESFGPGGTLARYAEDGVEVTLLCATRGEVGSLPPDLQGKVEDVAALREHELRCAANILNLKDVFFLGYRDSGMPGSSDNGHPNALVAAELEEVAGKIEAYIREIKPHVVITFDPIGGYHHPDHIAIQRATVLAFENAAREEGSQNLPPPHQAQKLYFHTFPHRLLRIFVRLLPLFGSNPRQFGRNKDIDLVAITEHTFPIHARINYRSVAEKKQAAAACHRSQQDPGSSSIFRYVERIFGGVENFMRAYPPAPDTLRESDLFEGVDLS